MADFTDSKTLRVVFGADSDALNRFDFFIFLRYFSLSEVDEHFGQYIVARLAKRAQIFSIGLTLKGESHDHNSFPKLKNFTLSRSNVWNLPVFVTAYFGSFF